MSNTNTPTKNPDLSHVNNPDDLDRLIDIFREKRHLNLKMNEILCDLEKALAYKRLWPENFNNNGQAIISIFFNDKVNQGRFLRSYDNIHKYLKGVEVTLKNNKGDMKVFTASEVYNASPLLLCDEVKERIAHIERAIARKAETTQRKSKHSHDGHGLS